MQCHETSVELIINELISFFFSTTGSEMSPESGRSGKPRIALTGDSDVLIRQDVLL